jgi:hypothetical protein
MRRARRARSRGSRCLERATFLWAWAKDNYARLAAWYGYRSTFATLVRALGKGFTSAPPRTDFNKFMKQNAPATPVLDGAWQRAVEAATASAQFFRSADAAAVCENLFMAAALTAPEARSGAGDPRTARGSEY